MSQDMYVLRRKLRPSAKNDRRSRISRRSPEAVTRTVSHYRQEGINIFYTSFDHYQGKEDRLLEIFDALAVCQLPVNLWFEFAEFKGAAGFQEVWSGLNGHIFPGDISRRCTTTSRISVFEHPVGRVVELAGR